MKRTAAYTLMLSGILFCSSGKSQTTVRWNKYSVSHAVSTTDLNYKKLFHGKAKAALENNIADFYLYKNGMLVKPPKDSVRNFFVAGCICFQFDDTLLLNSGLGRSAGVGVGIKIYKDRFSSSLHANAGENSMYKYKKSDSVYRRDITAEPESQSLILLHRPSFQPNEIIIGEYNAVYKRFYQNYKHKDTVSKYTVRLIFKCKVTGMSSMRSAGAADNR